MSQKKSWLKPENLIAIVALALSIASLFFSVFNRATDISRERSISALEFSSRERTKLNDSFAQLRTGFPFWEAGSAMNPTAIISASDLTASRIVKNRAKSPQKYKTVRRGIDGAITVLTRAQACVTSKVCEKELMCTLFLADAQSLVTLSKRLVYEIEKLEGVELRSENIMAFVENCSLNS